MIYGGYDIFRKISKPKPVKDYFELEGRFKCMSEEQIQAIQEDIDLTEHLEDAVSSLRIVLAADESVKTGKVVEL